MGRVQIFVPGIGQYDNIGDIILRRQLIEWLRPIGRLHVFVGGAPEDYPPGLGVGPDDLLYRSFRQWYAAGMRSALRGEASYVFKPGEIQLTLVGMKEHLGMLPMLVVVKARGGKVARVGAGSRNFAAVPRLLMRPSIALSDLTAWRDDHTAEYLRGAVMPDLAFGEGAAPEMTDAAAPPRDRLVVSMRSDRPLPDEAWLSAVRSFAEGRGLRLTVVTQVLRDRERSNRLGSLLGAEVIDWDGRDHAGQEARLRDVYRQSALTVSDRLHVLITAFTEGSTPLGLLVDRSDKIERHFSAAGMAGIGVPAAGLGADQLVGVLEASAERGPELQLALGEARERLARVRSELERLYDVQSALSPALAGIG